MALSQDAIEQEEIVRWYFFALSALNTTVHPNEPYCVILAVTDFLLLPLTVSDLRELRVESRERRVSEGRERRVSEGREPEMLDGLEQLYRALEQANVTALGDPKPCSRQELRRCFTQRARDPLLNDRLHRVRALRSTLKVAETEDSVSNTAENWGFLEEKYL